MPAAIALASRSAPVEEAILVLDPQGFSRLADAWPNAQEVGEEDPTLIANAGENVQEGHR